MKDNIVYIRHISEATEKIQSYTKDISFEDFSSNDMVFDAVVRELEIIGEAATKVSSDLKDQYPDMPWRQMQDIRNFLIHHYFSVSKKIVWETCQNDIPKLKKSIQKIIKDHP